MQADEYVGWRFRFELSEHPPQKIGREFGAAAATEGAPEEQRAGQPQLRFRTDDLDSSLATLANLNVGVRESNEGYTMLTAEGTRIVFS